MSTVRTILTEEQIDKDIQLFNKAINLISDVERKEQVINFVNSIKDNLYSAPASSKADHHDAYVCGLVHHSLEVFRKFADICKIWAPEISKDTIIVCGLFHDIGKACTINNLPIYIEETEKWKLERGIYYNLNPEIRDGLTHAQRSVRLLSYHNVQLTEDEYLAILAHDFLYTEENISFKYKMNKVGHLLHFADVWTVMGKK